jgi:glucan phosphoethanolaminetransferase (alkaline phosphatase superfamily)
MAGGVLQYVKSRFAANTSHIAGKAVAYAMAFLTLIFCLAALFVWLAETESLVIACLIFAALFAVAAIIAAVVARVYARRDQDLQRNRAGTAAAMMMAFDPQIARVGVRAARLVGRHAPVGAVAAAAAIGVILVLLNSRRGRE